MCPFKLLADSFGNLLAMGSTIFLMGPWRQIKNMFDPSRLIATLVYLGLLVCTLVVAFAFPNIILLIVLIVLQFLALVWYTASYIPGGQAAIRGCATSCCSG